MRIKVLKSGYRVYEGDHELINHFKERQEEELRDYCTEIEPVFNRDGHYLVGDKCFFEFQGKAYLSDKKQFLGDLDRINLEERDSKSMSLLSEIMIRDSSLLTKEQIADCNTYNTLIKRSVYQLKFKLGTRIRMNKYKKIHADRKLQEDN